MITACKNWRAEQSPRSTARFDRQTRGKKQTESPNRLHSFYRARYYDVTTGEFTSRDPLEYVDGMSAYTGYFVLGETDPSGQLRKVELNKPKIGNCGGFSHISKWSLDVGEDNGIIIQMVCFKNDFK